MNEALLRIVYKFASFDVLSIPPNIYGLNILKSKEGHYE
jgi:hypothetical protein